MIEEPGLLFCVELRTVGYGTALGEARHAGEAGELTRWLPGERPRDQGRQVAAVYMAGEQVFVDRTQCSRSLDRIADDQVGLHRLA